MATTTSNSISVKPGRRVVMAYSAEESDVPEMHRRINSISLPSPPRPV
jgi:hypothetical protein